MTSPGVQLVGQAGDEGGDELQGHFVQRPAANTHIHALCTCQSHTHTFKKEHLNAYTHQTAFTNEHIYKHNHTHACTEHTQKPYITHSLPAMLSHTHS